MGNAMNLQFTQDISAHLRLFNVGRSFIMVEVSKEKFQEITSQIPYRTSFVLGQSGVRYEGLGRKLKNTLFAKQDNGKYYVLESLVS